MSFLFLLFIPPYAEAIVFLFLIIIFFAINKSFKPKSIPTSIAIVSILGFIALIVTNEAKDSPYLLLIYTILALLGLSFRRLTSTKKNYLSLFLAVSFYGLMYWQTTFVAKDFNQDVYWTLERDFDEYDSGKKTTQGYVKLYYPNAERQRYDYMQSAELTNYLTTKNTKTVTVTYSYLYHFGRQAGYSIKAVDGRAFKKDSGGGGCASGPIKQGESSSCPKVIAPDYYWGLKFF